MLAVVLLGNTVASLFYYLRWIAPAVSSTAPADRTRTQPGRWASATVVSAAVLSVVIGLAAGGLWDVVDVDFLT